MTWIQDFFAAFDGPAYATAFFSLTAVVVSVVAIVRTRTPRPHWEFVSVTEAQAPDETPAYTDAYGNAVFPLIDTWAAKFRQSGPGDAEGVTTEIQLPDGTTTPENPTPNYITTRGTEFSVLLCSGQKRPGIYRVKIQYRCLPNTRKLQPWEYSVTLT